MKRVLAFFSLALGIAMLAGCSVGMSKEAGETFDHVVKVRRALGHIYETGTPGLVRGDSTFAAVELLRTDKHKTSKEARSILDGRLAAWREANPMMRAGYVREIREHT